jgi:branched-chain amino acid transport system ATP-binding protein
MLCIENIKVRYGGIVALLDVSINVEKGESVLLVGANGAGKSSLINAVIGLAPAQAGRIRFAGKDVTSLSCPARARLGIGYFPEARRIFRSLTVRENVMSGTLGIPAKQAKSNFEWIEKMFPLLTGRADQLSGGQQQVVAIARAVSTLPKLLLLNEPFLGLALVWIERISESIREIPRRGTTILMTEQMARPLLKLVDRAYVMRGGEVRRSGTFDEIRDVALAGEYL